MPVSSLPLPRFVKPEQLDIGDTIRVSYDADDFGIATTRTGTIAARDYRGQERVLTTAQGGTLLVWVPGHKSPRITLLAKVAPEQEQLSLFAELDGRIA